MGESIEKAVSRSVRIAELESTLAARDAEIERLKAEKDGAYSERDRLVAALSIFFPSFLARHEGVDWDDDWRWVVYIDGPTGQMSWHIHDSELPMFDHLSRLSGSYWDGHSTEEKYRRLAGLLAAIDEATEKETE